MSRYGDYPPEWDRWPVRTRDVYEGMQTYRIVGASMCAGAILDALEALAVAVAEGEGDVSSELDVAGSRFCELKPSTASYANLTTWLIAELPTGPSVVPEVRRRVAIMQQDSRTSLDRIVAAAKMLIEPRFVVLVHDYSSTVLRVLAEAGRGGQRHRVIVTAGEPIDQGARVAEAVASYGHAVTYVPDTGIGRVMPEVDIVLSGVETLFRDGALANTVGTYPLALVAREAKVELFGITECMKIHPMAAGVEVRDLTASLLRSWPRPGVALPVGTEIRTEVLDLTPGHLVTGYVTEEGILTPTQVSAGLARVWARLAA